MKVLIHINQSENWNMVLGNVTNLLHHGETSGTSYEIEVVANGPAVKELQIHAARDCGIYPAFISLPKASVKICACSIALESLKITTGSLFQFVSTVPSGVVEIVKKQQEGYAYLKP